MKVKYTQEFLRDIRKEIQGILQEDYDEIEYDKERRKLNPNWDLYQRVEDQGDLYIFTCRHEGDIIGYMTVIVHADLHDKYNTCATQDILFLSKPYRKGFIGYNLVRFAENCLKQDGLTHLTITTTSDNPVDGFMKRLGYKEVEKKFERKL